MTICRMLRRNGGVLVYCYIPNLASNPSLDIIDSLSTGFGNPNLKIHLNYEHHSPQTTQVG
jgi:hypothetical protein